MSEIEQAICYFEWRKQSITLDDAVSVHEQTALEALREKQERENPQPLTLEQLKERVGNPVWIVDTVCHEVECLRFHTVISHGYTNDKDYRFEQFGTDIGIIRWECKYGETWLAFDHPPKEATHG